MKLIGKYCLLATLVFLLLADAAFGQCAMCKATMDGSEDAMAEGLNRGILYLMAAPYVLFIILGVVFFRKKIRLFFRELGNSY